MVCLVHTQPYAYVHIQHGHAKLFFITSGILELSIGHRGGPVAKYSRSSMARTPLELWKYVRDRGSSI